MISMSEKQTFDSECPENSVAQKGRGRWNRKLEYMLSMVGYCVGLGNLWRFPYLCMKNGGGAFLIPFLIVLVACGLPMFFLETAVGQFTGKGVMNVWEICPLFKGVGTGMIISLTILSLYYNVIIAWTLHYLGSSFIAPLPWSRHSISDINSNASYIKHSYQNGYENRTDVNVIRTTNISGGLKSNSVLKNTMSSEEVYWQEDVLQMSDGIHTIGTVTWQLALCFLAAWIIVYLCLMKGIRSVGKVVYVTATMPYILLLVLLIRGLTLPGSATGIIYYLKPDFSKLLEIKVWIEAALQVFYSLGPTWGPIITMASYNRFNNNCYRDAIILTFICEGTSMYGGLAIFSILGFMAHQSNVPIEKVVKSGPGLGFIAYPEAIARLPLSNVWAVLFFCMLLTVGLDSQFAVTEVVITTFTDRFPKLRKQRALFTAIMCGVFFLLGIPMITQGGIYIFQLLDWYIAVLSVPVFGIVECVMIGWVYGAEMFSRDVELMLGKRVPFLMRMMWCLATPFILMTIIVFTLRSYVPPTYGSYEFPRYAEIIGWVIAALPIIPLPIQAVLEVAKAPGNTILQKLQTACQPTSHRVPVANNEAILYPSQDRSYPGGLKERIKLNLLGKV